MHSSTPANRAPSTTDEADRVRRHTSPPELERIDQLTREYVRYYACRPRHVIDARIAELEHMWDMERILELNASLLALTGAVLGVAKNRKWFLLTGVVLAFLAQHATAGWCPPVPMLRKLGVRTQGELDQEKFALKALRGDFDDLSLGRASVGAVVQAVER